LYHDDWKGEEGMRLPLFFLLIFLLIPLQTSAQFRILLYHAHPNFGFSQSSFSEELDFLRANDYHTITLDRFIGWLKNDDSLPIRPILITLDDNYIPVYTSAYPLLKTHGFTAVNFAHTYYVGVITGNGDHCDWDEIGEMEREGVIFTESHTISHNDLTALSPEAAQEEIAGSKAAIEAHIPQKVCKYIAYPYGAYNDDVINLCIEAGYTAGIAVGNAMNYHDTPLFEIKRISVDGLSLDDFKQKIGFTELPPAPPGKGWTIDNDEVNFSTYDESWVLSTTPTGFYGKNYLYHPADDGTHKVRWAVYLPASGKFRVNAFWLAEPDRSSSVQYLIHHDDGITTVTVNQRENGGRWNPLGGFRFSSDRSAMIYLSDRKDGSVAADGIWFEPIKGVAGLCLY
jgi:peptidoglycan/xylan/chitin deacetylase (PgdA/CDA1 family)